jgi:hypothetical protein
MLLIVGLAPTGRPPDIVSLLFTDRPKHDAERGARSQLARSAAVRQNRPALAGPETAEFDRVVRLELFRIAAATGRVPSEVEVAERLAEPREAVADAIRRLADGKALILAPGGTSIWAANPFCAVPSGFRVRTQERTYWAICIWDALGIPAALSADATIGREAWSLT